MQTWILISIYQQLRIRFIDKVSAAWYNNNQTAAFGCTLWKKGDERTMYLPNSTKAAEFLCHEEVMQTLAYAQENKNNLPLIQEIQPKPAYKKG